jgi:hypothetical protein
MKSPQWHSQHGANHTAIGGVRNTVRGSRLRPLVESHDQRDTGLDGARRPRWRALGRQQAVSDSHHAPADRVSVAEMGRMATTICSLAKMSYMAAQQVIWLDAAAANTLRR